MTQGRLVGKVVLVTGSTGNVGWGIAELARREGARVVLPVRGEANEAGVSSRDVLRVRVDRFSEPELVALRERAVAQFGAVDHVVAPLGGFWQRGASLAQPAEELRELLGVYVEAQHALARAMAPELRRTAGSYTMVTGAAGEHVIPNAGLLVTAVGAQYALSRVLRAELARDPLRFNEVRIACRVEREPRPGVVPSLVAADAFVRVMAGDFRSAVVRYDGSPDLVTMA
jgi:3-oxoacyl-[acyl-carrier protein] reductase